MVQYKNFIGSQRFIYLNEESSFLLDFIEYINVNEINISRFLTFLQFSDTNQDGKIGLNDIAYFDNQYFSVPKLNYYLNLPESELVVEGNENYETIEARFVNMNADFELSQKPWPFQMEDVSSDYATLKLNDELKDEITDSYLSMFTQCDDYENNASEVFSIEDQFIVPINCKLIYRLCNDAAGLECGLVDLLYYYNQEFTKFPPHYLYAEMQNSNPVFDFKLLLTQDSFFQQYEDVKKRDDSNEIKAFLICKLIKESGYYCDESKFDLAISS